LDGCKERVEVKGGNSPGGIRTRDLVAENHVS
jgi:hypothetical protein